MDGGVLHGSDTTRKVFFIIIILPMILSLQVLFQGTPRAQTVELHGLRTLSPVDVKIRHPTFPCPPPVGGI